MIVVNRHSLFLASAPEWYGTRRTTVKRRMTISFSGMRARYAAIPLAALLLNACGKPGVGATCGFSAVAGSTVLLGEFSRPGQTLSEAPATLPERLVVRLVAGPAYPAIVGRNAEGLLVGIDGPLPPGVIPGFGVLILDPTGKAHGVLLYESRPIKGAPTLGGVSVSSKTVPLIGIQVDPARIEDARCPFFPDSVLR